MDSDFEVPIADPHEQRVPCVLLLDVSGSMAGEPIRQLNEALQTFKSDLAADTLAAKRAEVAVIRFSDSAELVHDFKRVGDLALTPFTAAGNTASGAALDMALKEVEIRKQYYRSHGVQYLRPWIFLITDGAPTDKSAYEAAAQRATEAVSNNKAIVFAIGVGNANFESLKMAGGSLTFQLSPQFTFRELFRFVSSSIRAASASRPGEQIPIQPGVILLPR